MALGAPSNDKGETTGLAACKGQLCPSDRGGWARGGGTHLGCSRRHRLNVQTHSVDLRTAASETPLTNPWSGQPVAAAQRRAALKWHTRKREHWIRGQGVATWIGMKAIFFTRTAVPASLPTTAGGPCELRSASVPSQRTEAAWEHTGEVEPNKSLLSGLLLRPLGAHSYCCACSAGSLPVLLALRFPSRKTGRNTYLSGPFSPTISMGNDTPVCGSVSAMAGAILHTRAAANTRAANMRVILCTDACFSC